MGLPHIPWISSVIIRAQELADGNRSAGAAAHAVTLATTATIALIAATVAPRR